MPTNLEQGGSMQFITRFKDVAGALVEPSSASIYVFYNSSGVQTSTDVTLTRSGDFWTGTWDSTGADLGWVVWIASSNVVTFADFGEVRIIRG